MTDSMPTVCSFAAAVAVSARFEDSVRVHARACSTAYIMTGAIILQVKMTTSHVLWSICSLHLI